MKSLQTIVQKFFIVIYKNNSSVSNFVWSCGFAPNPLALIVIISQFQQSGSISYFLVNTLIQIPLQSFKFQILRQFWVRSLLVFRQLASIDSN